MRAVNASFLACAYGVHRCNAGTPYKPITPPQLSARHAALLHGITMCTDAFQSIGLFAARSKSPNPTTGKHTTDNCYWQNIQLRDEVLQSQMFHEIMKQRERHLYLLYISIIRPPSPAGSATHLLVGTRRLRLSALRTFPCTQQVVSNLIHTESSI